MKNSDEFMEDYLDRVAGRQKPLMRALEEVKRDALLAERENTHGDYAGGARTIQGLKAFFHRHAGWSQLDDCQKEAIDMICTKLGRIMNGHANEVDHWKDTAGYALLIVERLK